MTMRHVGSLRPVECPAIVSVGGGHRLCRRTLSEASPSWGDPVVRLLTPPKAEKPTAVDEVDGELRVCGKCGSWYQIRFTALRVA